jgi:hypothetical protein
VKEGPGCHGDCYILERVQRPRCSGDTGGDKLRLDILGGGEPRDSDERAGVDFVR